MTATAPLYVALEGGEGCGKSTQAALLAERLGAGTVLTREPGATALGKALRALLLDPASGTVDPRAEALLMAADRAQHVQEVVAPALAAGHHVVSDRSAFSSLAYQGYGRGLDLDEVRHLSDWATGGRWPDLVVFLDLGTEAPAEHAGTVLDDRFELAGEAFHQRVLDGFRELCRAEPHRWARVDASGTVDAVAAAVSAVVDGFRAAGRMGP